MSLFYIRYVRINKNNNRNWKTCLSTTKCHHCGRDHKRGEQRNVRELCPVFRYHQRLSLHQQHARVLRWLPCHYCDSSSHVTQMCDVMHAYCHHHDMRGHLSRPWRCDVSRTQRDKWSAKFAAFSRYGIRTRRSNGKKHHRWGKYVPEGHECKSLREGFSDFESENESCIASSPEGRNVGEIGFFATVLWPHQKWPH